MIPKDARTSSSMKRTGTIDQPMNDPSAKRFKTFTSTQGDISDQQSSSIVQPSSSSASSLYSKLDPNDPEQAKRMEQRRKTITKGKNTAGYDAYIQQIPKHKRRPRSMETPSTPDPTLDIPNKRWQGLVKAWYVQRVVCLTIDSSIQS
jgi:histone RNA hairpin-binding protein